MRDARADNAVSRGVFGRPVRGSRSTLVHVRNLQGNESGCGSRDSLPRIRPFVDKGVIMNSRLLAIAASVACATPLSAQSFNLDFGEATATPSSSYAAAGLPGYWNGIRADGWVDYVLMDLSGTLTTVHFQQSGAVGPILETDPSVSGDDALLMNDGLITYTYGVDSCFYFNGLQPGVYELITYAWRPNHPALMASSHVDNTPGVEISGGAWPGAHVHGVTYAREIVTVTASGFMGPHSGLAAGSAPVVGAVCNGIQL